MTYSELSNIYGREVAAQMFAILSLEPKSKLIQDLLDFMGTRVLDEWAANISKETNSEPA